MDPLKERKLLEALLERQRLHCPLVLRELHMSRRKTSHWSWWVFPTEQQGMSEPTGHIGPTAVSPRSASELLRRAPPSWVSYS